MASPIEEIFIKLGFQFDKKEVNNADKSIKSVVSSVKKIALAAVGAIVALDRLSTSLAKNNQELINFNRQTGIGIDNLNKIAGAGMMVDVNFTPEKAAQGLKSLESNLAQIRLGQGDIAPFQMLGISPLGKNAVQVIEDLRVAIRGIDDMTAVNLIQQMGLSPEFISLLRLTREEYEELSAQANKFMLDDKQRAALQKYAIQLNLVHKEFAYLKDKFLIAVMPSLINFLKGFMAILEVVGKFGHTLKKMIEWIGQFKGALLGIGIVVLSLITRLNGAIKILGFTLNLAFGKWLAILTALYLLLEDLAVYAMGGKSLTGLIADKFKTQDKKTDESYKNVFNQERNPIQKYFDWFTSSAGGFIPGGAKRQEDYYKTLFDMLPNFLSNVNQTKNVTQNNYLSFGNSDNKNILNAVSDLTYAYIQADRAV